MEADKFTAVKALGHFIAQILFWTYPVCSKDGDHKPWFSSDPVEDEIIPGQF